MKDNYPRSELGYKKRKGSRPVRRQHRAPYQVALRQEDMERVEQVPGVQSHRPAATTFTNPVAGSRVPSALSHRAKERTASHGETSAEFPRLPRRKCPIFLQYRRGSLSD